MWFNFYVLFILVNIVLILLWSDNSSSPGGNLHSQISVDGNSQQGKDRALGDDQQEAGEEEAGVKLSIESQTDDNSQRDDQSSYRNISHS